MVKTVLPTKEQIFALTDLPALYGLKDDVEKSIIQMEAQLEFLDGDGDDSWASRATNALALHRYVDRQLSQRIGMLKDATPKGAKAVRPETDCDLLTVEVLARRPEINAATVETVQEVDAHLAWLTARINAVTADREDETAMAAGDRDEGFLAATGNALRLMRGQRMALQTRRGEISKAEKLAALAIRDSRRERLFIDAAREVLDKDTFLRLWDRVDRMEAYSSAPAPTEGVGETPHPEGGQT